MIVKVVVIGLGEVVGQTVKNTALLASGLLGNHDYTGNDSEQEQESQASSRVLGSVGSLNSHRMAAHPESQTRVDENAV